MSEAQLLQEGDSIFDPPLLEDLPLRLLHSLLGLAQHLFRRLHQRHLLGPRAVDDLLHALDPRLWQEAPKLLFQLFGAEADGTESRVVAARAEIARRLAQGAVMTEDAQ